MTSDPWCPPPHLEHLNFLGEDERWGPMAVSMRREERGPRVLHRVIMRTGQVGAGNNGGGLRWGEGGGDAFWGGFVLFWGRAGRREGGRRGGGGQTAATAEPPAPRP